MMTAVALICMAMASCGGDDKNDKKASEKTIAAAEVVYSANITGNLTDVCDMYISYCNAEGQWQREKATQPWNKTVVVRIFPAKIGIKFEAMRKDNAELKEATYDIVATPTISYQARDANGAYLGSKGQPTIAATQLNAGADKLEEFIYNLNNGSEYTGTLYLSDDKKKMYYQKHAGE